MGLNAFFSYVVVLELGYRWEVALGAVFVAGLLFVVLSLTPVRRWIIDAIPFGLKMGISAGIGLFLGILALKNAGIITASPATLVTSGDLLTAAPILALLGFCLIVALAARRVPGATIIGVLGVTAVGIGIGVSEWQGLVAAPPDPTPTLLALDIAGALQVGMISVILTFLIVDLFDTTGTLIGVAKQANLLDAEGKLPRIKRAVIADLRWNRCRRHARHIARHELRRERGWHQCRRTYRHHGRRRGGLVPRVPLLRAPGTVDSRLRNGTGHSLCRLSDGQSARGYRLARDHRIGTGRGDGHGHFR